MLNSNLKKLVVVFTVLVVIFGFVSSYLFIQVSDLENQVYDLAKQTEELQNQKNVLEGQVLEYQNQTNQLEGQVSEYQYQINQLESQVSQLEQDKFALQENVSELEKFIEEKITKVKITEFYISSLTSHPPMIHGIFLGMTIHNQGVNPVENLMIIINFTNVEISWNRTIDIIRPGGISHLTFETHTFASGLLYNSNIVATLYANDLLLDEVTLISPINKYFASQ